jgi:ABC-type amino acid transport substrate-binding protein
MNEYIVINLFNGIVTLIVASNIVDATHKAKDYFTEPDGPVAMVEIVGKSGDIFYTDMN